jgi:hypothetical protein
MLIPGAAQAHRNNMATNKNEVVGNGIYVSPHFTTSLFGYTQPATKGNQTYRVVLQCRLRPEVLKCTPCTDYWVIN